MRSRDASNTRCGSYRALSRLLQPDELLVRFDPHAVAALQLFRVAEAEILGPPSGGVSSAAEPVRFPARESHGRRCRGGRVRPAASRAGRLGTACPRQSRDLWRRRFSTSRAQDWPPAALQLRRRREALQRPVSGGFLDILVLSVTGNTAIDRMSRSRPRAWWTRS